MLFQTPSITEREAEVVGEIETIRRQLNLPKLREWPGLPWRAIHDRILQASKNPALGNSFFENADAAEDEEPGAENPDAWSAAPGYHAALSFVLQLADAPKDEIDEGVWQPERDARPWVRFCLTAHCLQARTLLRRTREYDRLWDELEREARRRGLPERMISALAEAAIGGGLTAALYESATMA